MPVWAFPVFPVINTEVIAIVINLRLMDAGQVHLVIYSFKMIMINLLVLARLTTELFFLVKFRNHFG